MLAAPLWALPFLTVVHTAGDVAVLETEKARAVVVLDVQTPRGRTANRAGHLLGFALVGVFTLAVVLPLVDPTLRVLPPTAATVLLSALGLTIIGVALFPTIPTPSDVRASWARRDQPRHLSGGGQVSHAGQMAAWPQGTGAGRRLFDVVCSAADKHQITLTLNARSPASARLYTRCGFTHDQPGHGPMTRLPVSPDPPHARPGLSVLGE